MTIPVPFEISAQQSEDAPAIEAILDTVFGPDRKHKTSYQFRHGTKPVESLSLVARQSGIIVGTIRFWPVLIGGADVKALLLGPLAVNPELRGTGVGGALISRGLDLAVQEGYRIAVLVGDGEYYHRFGFEPAAIHGLAMPGERERLHIRELVNRGLKGVSGIVTAWSSNTQDTEK